MDIELILPLQGPRTDPMIIEVLGELDEADVQKFLGRTSGRTRTPLQRISERHKAMARAVASGTELTDIAFYFSVDLVTIRSLMRDPAFRNLVSFYQRAEDDVLQTTQERLSAMTNTAIDLIQDRLDDEEERKKVTIPQALAIAEMGTDRTGNGPASTSVSLNINAGLAERMKSARAQAAAAMRDITPQEEAA